METIEMGRYEDDYKGNSHCPIAPDLEEVGRSIQVLVTKVDTLISLNRDIIRWLLIVVCIIALGRSAFDVGRDLIKHATIPVHAETKE